MVILNSEKLTFMRQQNNLSGTQTDLWKNTRDTSKEFGNYFYFEKEQNCELLVKLWNLNMCIHLQGTV